MQGQLFHAMVCYAAGFKSHEALWAAGGLGNCWPPASGRARPPGRCVRAHCCRSVPSGRVGAARDAVFRSNEAFREAVDARAARDVAELEAKLGRKCARGPRGTGVMRWWAERRIQWV